MLKKLLNATGIVLLVLLIALVLPLTLPKLFGYRLYNVLTPSMEPAIPVNSVIYAKSVDPDSLEVGDVIVFLIAGGLDTVETHRIVAVDRTEKAFVTKGDANLSEDQNRVLYSGVIGKVVCHIPFYGSFAEWLHSTRGIAVCSVLFAAVLLMFVTADRIKPKGKNE